jgi:hypothetical protein
MVENRGALPRLLALLDGLLSDVSCRVSGVSKNRLFTETCQLPTDN